MTGVGTGPLVLREAVIEDAVAVGATFSAACRIAYREILPPSFHARHYGEGVQEARWAERIRRPEPGFRIVVATVADAVVGAVRWGPPGDPELGVPGTGEVHHVFVAPDRARGGVGTALLGEARRELAAAGVHRSVLWVFEDNAGARAFYERTGWMFSGWARPDPTLVGDGISVRECLYEAIAPGDHDG